jgi:predicted transcriptional regulator of viral defense system
MATITHTDKAMEIVRRQGVARTRDFDAAGVPRVYLRRLRDEGRLIQISRGLYKSAAAEAGVGSSLAEAARAVPRGVVCLLSALQHHQLTTQTPHAIWMMLGPKDWVPTDPPVAIRVIRASGRALSAGVDTEMIDGVAVPMTSPVKTVVDCFKYRNKIGLDVAIEALQDLMKGPRGRKFLSDLWAYAEIDRVQKVIRPYLEALT